MVKKYCVLWVMFRGLVTVPLATGAPEMDHALYKGGREEIGWEVRYSLGSSLSYRFSGHERVGMRDKRKEFTHSITRFDNKSLSTLLDWHPAQNGFRTSIGIFAGSHYMEYFAEPVVDLRFEGAIIHVDKSKLPDEIVIRDQVVDLSKYGIEEKITIEGKTISGYKNSIPEWIVIDPQVFQLHRDDIHVTASADFKTLASFFGIGWGNRPLSDQRLRYSMDLGVIYLGRPDVSLNVGGDILDVHPLLTKELNEYIDKEERKLQRKAESFRLMPYLSFGVSLAF